MFLVGAGWRFVRLLLRRPSSSRRPVLDIMRVAPSCFTYLDVCFAMALTDRSVVQGALTPRRNTERSSYEVPFTRPFRVTDKHRYCSTSSAMCPRCVRGRTGGGEGNACECLSVIAFGVIKGASRRVSQQLREHIRLLVSLTCVCVLRGCVSVCGWLPPFACVRALLHYLPISVFYNVRGLLRSHQSCTVLSFQVTPRLAFRVLGRRSNKPVYARPLSEVCSRLRPNVRHQTRRHREARCAMQLVPGHSFQKVRRLTCAMVRAPGLLVGGR